MKKLIAAVLLLAAFLAVCATAAASPEFTKKRVAIFYDAPDNVLACQNKKEDVAKSEKQLAKILAANYKKRFDVQSVQRITAVKGEYNLQDLFAIPADQAPLIIRLRLVRSGAAGVKGTNSFGDRATLTVPTVTSSLQEIIGDREQSRLYIYDYGEKVYRGMVYTSFLAYDTPRSRSRNAIRYYIEDVCKFNKEINKFTNPGFYDREVKRYAGDFSLAYDDYKEQPARRHK